MFLNVWSEYRKLIIWKLGYYNFGGGADISRFDFLDLNLIPKKLKRINSQRTQMRFPHRKFG